MPTPIKVKRRHTNNGEPTTAHIQEGELAVNTITHLLFCRDDNDNVFPIGNVPKGTVNGTILIWNDTTQRWEENNLSGLVLRPSVVTDHTTARTLTTADENAIILFTSGSAVTVTLPTDAEDGDIEIGFLCHLHQEGAGQVTASSTGTVRAAVGPSTYEQYSSISVMKIASDTWKVVGDQTS